MAKRSGAFKLRRIMCILSTRGRWITDELQLAL